MLSKDDKTWIEDSMLRILAKFYQNMIAPKIVTKDDLGEVNDRLKRLDNRMDNIEAKVGSLEKAVWNVSDHQGKRLESHEVRILALEESS